MIRIVARAVRAPGIRDPEGLRGALDAGLPLEGPVPGGGRPSAVSPAVWRRMSQLSRRVAEVATEALEAWPVDRSELAIVWGTVFGELVTTAGLLERMFVEGPARVSPTAFQTSLFGTPIAHLSIALGLEGPAETVSAGGASGAMALLRGLDAIESGAPAALVLAGDDLSEMISCAWALRGQPSPRLGEVVGAVLLARSDRGAPIAVDRGIVPGPGPAYHRGVALPGEEPLAPIEGGTAIEASLGSCPSAGVALAAAASVGGGRVFERDGRSDWTVTVGGP